MTRVDEVSFLAGFGLLLFGMRFLVSSLDETLVSRIATRFERVGERTTLLFGAGLAGTLILQASSIAIVLTMGLVQRSALTLEQGIVLMLGAAVGTTLKAWFFTLPYSVLGPVAVGVSSVLLVLVRGFQARKTLELIFALGVMYFGWETVTRAMEPALTGDWLQSLLGVSDSSTLGGLMLTVGAGFVVTVVVQSSSAVVFLVATMAHSGWMDLPSAAALILGANVGTTLMPLYASLEYGSDARRLAFAHVLVKALGVAVVALVFHSFLNVVGVLSQRLGIESDYHRLALVHTLFNGINAAIWLPLLPILARVLRGRSKPDERARGALSGALRKMLTNLPEEAAAAVRQERDRIVRALKVALDDVTASLQGEGRDLDAVFMRAGELRQRVRAAQALAASASARASAPCPELSELMFDLSAALGIAEHLQEIVHLHRTESTSFSRVREERLGAVMGEMASAYDRLWAYTFGTAARLETHRLDRRSFFTTLETSAHRALYAPPQAGTAEFVTLERELDQLERIWDRLFDLAESVALNRAERAA